MRFPSLAKLFGTQRAKRQTPRRRSLRLSVEQLEDRMVPSNFIAATVPDLIADINASNLAGGSNTITLVAGKTFQLTAVDNTTDGSTGLPIIAANDTVTIVGNGDTISRSTASGTPAFRLLDVAGGASLTLENLTLQGGLTTTYGGAKGGAIYNQGALTLDAVTVQNNIAHGQNGVRWGESGQLALGGAMYSNGALTLQGGTTIQDNQALGGWGGQGQPGWRGLANGGGGGGGGEALGGGVYVAGGTVTVTNATLSANTALGGNGGTGGAAFQPHHGGNGGAASNGFGGGMYVAGGTVFLTSATLTSNTAAGGNGGSGGPGGFSSKGGGGGSGSGGALYVGGGTVELRNDSIQNNAAQAGSGGQGWYGGAKGGNGQGIGGGLYIITTLGLDAFTLANTIHNTASTSNNDIYGSYTLIH